MPQLLGRGGAIVGRVGVLGEPLAGKYLGPGAGTKEIEELRPPAEELGQEFARAAKRARQILVVSVVVGYWQRNRLGFQRALRVSGLEWEFNLGGTECVSAKRPVRATPA